MANLALSVPGAFPTDAGQGAYRWPPPSWFIHGPARSTGQPDQGLQSVCVQMRAPDLKKPGKSDGGFWAVAAWEDRPFPTDAECAAATLTEAAKCLSDRTDRYRTMF